MTLLRGKNAIITGCARGIGKSILEIFSENGANIWACYRTQSEKTEQHAQELSRKFDVEIIPLYFDLSNDDQVKNAMLKIVSSKKVADILVNNAGVTYNALFQMTTSNKMKEIFEINYFAPMKITQYILKLMIKHKRGSIINISSTAALDGNSGRSIYGASKSALICTTKALAAEVAAFNIRVNAIAPGITQTDMVASSMSDQVINETLQQSSMKRMGQTNEIANTALFLASDLSSYITGQVIRVDGGML